MERNFFLAFLFCFWRTGQHQRLFLTIFPLPVFVAPTYPFAPTCGNHDGALITILPSEILIGFHILEQSDMFRQPRDMEKSLVSKYIF
jgi:hypothetical protein